MSIYFYEEHSHLNARNPVWGAIREHSIDDTLHWHENLEIIHNYEGRCVVQNGNEVIELLPGDTCVVNSKEIHGLCGSKSKSKNAYFILSEKFCAEIGFFTSSTVFQKKITDPRLKELFMKIEREYNSDDDYKESGLKIALLSVLLILSRDYTVSRTPESATPKIALTKRIMSYLREHYMEDITMEMLEERFQYSRFYISRVFKEVSGKAIVGYLNEIRVSRAREMLDGGTQSVAEIAALSGFDNQSYFGKVFKRIVGVAPLEYRAEKSATRVEKN